MIFILIYFLIAIGLSIDAFGVAITIGTTNSNKKIIYLEPIIVGIFHYIMPLIGNFISITFLSNLMENINILISIIFILLAIELYKSKDIDDSIFVKNIFSIIVISFIVSIDSLIIGLVLSLKNINIYLVSLIFFLTSLIFSFLGIKLGIKLKTKYHQYAVYIGIVILVLIAIKNML